MIINKLTTKRSDNYIFVYLKGVLLGILPDSTPYLEVKEFAIDEERKRELSNRHNVGTLQW